MAEFLDLSLKTSPCMKTSRVSCENQSFLKRMPPLSIFIVFLCYVLQYDEVILINLLDVCYHYLVFMDPVNGSKSKLLVKEQVSLQSKIKFGYECF